MSRDEIGFLLIHETRENDTLTLALGSIEICRLLVRLRRVSSAIALEVYLMDTIFFTTVFHVPRWYS